MTTVFKPVPFYAGNLTNDELARLVEHNYPHLQGPLLEMLKRFTSRSRYAEAERAAALPLPEHACPHCGSTFTHSD